MTAHGMLVTVFAAVIVTMLGWDYADAQTDPLRIVGPTLGLLVLTAGITWQLGV